MKHLSRKLCCLLLAALLAASAVTPALAASVAVKLNTRTAIYKSANTSSASIMTSRGTSMTMTAVRGGWARVTRGRLVGYVPVKYLTLKNRVKAYVKSSGYVYASPSTSAAKKAVSVNTALYIIGRDGSYARVQNASGSATGYIPASKLSSKKVTPPASSWKSKVVALDWYKGGSSALSVGSYGYLYDIATGTVVHIKRMGGTSHMDVEPASTSDTAKLKAISGGSYNWDRRAGILYAGGRFIACSYNTQPHGSQTLRNKGFNGQFCLHLVNSRTHGSNKVDSDHQATIRKAYNWAH